MSRHLGSRVSAMLALKPKQSVVFETYAGNGSRLMSQIDCAARRAGITKFSNKLLIAIDPSTRECVDIVRFTLRRKA